MIKIELLGTDEAARQIKAAEGRAPFVKNAFFEKLLRLQAERPADFEKLSPAARLSLNYYAAARRRHEALQENNAIETE